MNNAGPPLWPSSQSSWLQIQSSGFDFRHYQIFWEIVGLERELLGRKSSGSGLKSREYGLRDPSRWPRGNLYPRKLALTSPTSCGRYSSLADYTEFLFKSVCREMNSGRFVALPSPPTHSHLQLNYVINVVKWTEPLHLAWDGWKWQELCWPDKARAASLNLDPCKFSCKCKYQTCRHTVQTLSIVHCYTRIHR
jgi:hypothetical protein